MSTRVLSALHHAVEVDLVTRLEGLGAAVTVVRRCPDLADLLAAAAAGVGDVALVSASLRGLDREAVARLHDEGVALVGVSATEADERVLHQLGADRVVTHDAEAAALGTAVADAAALAVEGYGARGLRGLEGAVRTGGEPRRHTSGSSVVGLPTGGYAADPGPPELLDPSAPRPPAPIVAVWGPVGAPGRTTVAVNLAAELAATGIEVLLVDADTWGASIAQALALVDEAPGLVAATRASDQGRLDRVGLARLAPSVVANLRVLTGIPRPDRWPEVRQAALEHVLDLSRSIVDVVVVDCGFSLEDDEELSYDTLAPRRNLATLTSLARATTVLAVGAADPVGLQRLVRGVQDLGVVQAPTPRVVVNKLRESAVGKRPDRQIRGALTRFAGLADLVFLPWDPAACDAGILTGEPLRVSAPRSALREAVRELAMTLASDLGVDRAGARRAGILAPTGPGSRGRWRPGKAASPEGGI